MDLFMEKYTNNTGLNDCADNSDAVSSKSFMILNHIHYADYVSKLR